MKTVVIELDNWEPPSRNETNHWHFGQIKSLVNRLKTRIGLSVGEGPWPKNNVPKGQYPPELRKKLLDRLREKWAKKRFVFAEVNIRSCLTNPIKAGAGLRTSQRLYDHDNVDTKRLFDALVRMGWIVDDSRSWFFYHRFPSVKGDSPKTIVTLYIPENDADEAVNKSKVR